MRVTFWGGAKTKHHFFWPNWKFAIFLGLLKEISFRIYSLEIDSIGIIIL